MTQQLCFFLIICDDDGVWSETFASLNFAFALHFWQRHHFHHLVRLAELTKTGPNFHRDLPRIRTSVISPTTLWAHAPEIFTKGFDISQTVNNNENLLNQNYVILNPRPCAAKNNICALAQIYHIRTVDSTVSFWERVGKGWWKSLSSSSFIFLELTQISQRIGLILFSFSPTTSDGTRSYSTFWNSFTNHYSTEILPYNQKTIGRWLSSLILWIFPLLGFVAQSSLQDTCDGAIEQRGVNHLGEEITDWFQTGCATWSVICGS